MQETFITVSSQCLGSKISYLADSKGRCLKERINGLNSDNKEDYSRSEFLETSTLHL